MPEENTAPVESSEPAGSDETDLAAQVEKWKSLSRENEKKAKANAAAARRLEELENASKSETERLNARAEAAEKLAADSQSQALRLSVAFEKGLTPGQAKRLAGSTREELLADADEVLRDFPASKRPSGDADQGHRSGPPAAQDMNSWMRRQVGVIQ